MFDFTTIEEWVRARRPDITSDLALAAHLGVARRSIDRYRTRGMSAFTVDHLCTVRLDVWPGAIYPDWCSARRVVGEHLTRRKVAA